jgi:hypothetical protein
MNLKIFQRRRMNVGSFGAMRASNLARLAPYPDVAAVRSASGAFLSPRVNGARGGRKAASPPEICE